MTNNLRNKTAEETEEHRVRAVRIVNQLVDEYAAWYGWTNWGFGRNVALGEFIVDQVEHGYPEPWMVEAKAAYLKWRRAHPEVITPPRTPTF